MSTRGLFSFVDADKQTFHVYKHSDCYPQGPWGGIATILMATRFAWVLPRFEADEFATAFICAAKMSTNEWLHMQKLHELCDAREAREEALPREERRYDVDCVSIIADVPSYSHRGGGVRLLKTGHWAKVAPWDIAYHYTVHQEKEGRPLTVWAAEVVEKDDKMADNVIFKGTLEAAMAWAAALYNKEKGEEAAPPPRTGRLRPARMLL